MKDSGGVMFRLSALLCVAMFLALLLAGEDRGQLRPGLALAKAEGRLNLTPTAEILEQAEPALVRVAAPAQPTPQPTLQPSTPLRETSSQAETRQAAVAPAPEPQLAQPARRKQAEPVFTLSGQTAIPLSEQAAPAPAPSPAEAQVWYVTAQSVNVRQGPSTDAFVVGKLGRGEAATVIWQEGEDWARIVIEGDGLEGYVASRFLSTSAP